MKAKSKWSLTPEAVAPSIFAEQTKNMRSLNPEDIDQLVTINGMVIRTSNLIPEMREAHFRCSICKNTVNVELDRGRIEVCTREEL